MRGDKITPNLFYRRISVYRTVSSPHSQCLALFRGGVLGFVMPRNSLLHIWGEGLGMRGKKACQIYFTDCYAICFTELQRGYLTHIFGNQWDSNLNFIAIARDKFAPLEQIQGFA